MNARCWAVFNDDLYFGGTDGKIYKAWDGYTDNGSAVSADGSSAWNSFSSPSRKRLAAIRPVLRTVGDIDYSVGVGFDFKDILTPQASSTSSATSLWDVAEWDVALWAGEEVVSIKWIVRGGTGQTISTRVRVSAMQKIEWLRTDYRLEIGQGL
jgi:hypothetical protein